MNDETLLFFAKHPEALPLYEAFADTIERELGEVRIKVQKTQISFYNKRLFACVSFARVRKKRDCPPAYIVVTLGLGRRLASPRIEVAVEPYPGRWTHHLLVSDVADIDAELIAWVREAAAFAETK